jgi:uncharacterized membrane protein YesL
MKIESSFYRIWSWLTDILLLNLLWLVVILVGVGIPFGAATVAAFQIARKLVLQEETLIIRDFFILIRKNFISNTIHGLFVIGLILVMVYQYFLVQQMDYFGIKIIYYAMLLEFIIIINYLFPLISHFEGSFTNYWKSSLFLSHLHIWTTVKVVTTFIGAMVLVVFVHPLFLFFMIGILFVSNAYHFTPLLSSIEKSIIE